MMQREMVSNAPDFTSILNVAKKVECKTDGTCPSGFEKKKFKGCECHSLTEKKICSITQFEWRNPGVAYLSELEQNATTGKLTVCCRVLILVLSCLLLPADDTGLRHRVTIWLVVDWCRSSA